MTRRDVAGLAAGRSLRRARHDAQRIESVGQCPVSLLGLEQVAREGLEPHVGRVGVREAEQVLSGEVLGLREFR